MNFAERNLKHSAWNHVSQRSRQFEFDPFDFLYAQLKPLVVHAEDFDSSIFLSCQFFRAVEDERTIS